MASSKEAFDSYIDNIEKFKSQRPVFKDCPHCHRHLRLVRKDDHKHYFPSHHPRPWQIWAKCPGSDKPGD